MLLRRSVIVAAALALLCLPALCASPAAAVTIGTDLNRAPNVNYDCTVTPGTDAFGGRFLLRQGVPTCTYMATPVSLDESPQGRQPGGVLTSVTVRTGPVTGPMQATILGFTRTIQFGPQCCTFQAASQVFTPAPNTTTTVPVRLPMRNELQLGVGEFVDYLALTVLAPNVPIPMQDLGGGSTPGAIAFYPHVKPGDVRVDGAGLGGLVPLISGEFSPTCSASASGTAARTAAGGCSPAVALAKNRAKVRKGRASTTVLCNAAAPCVGSLRLMTKKKRGKSLASTTKLKLAAAGSKKVKIRLSSRGRSLIRRKRSNKIWMVSKLSSGGQKYTFVSRVKLYR